jgi:hypothetical protein
MNNERQRDDDEATSVNEPSGESPDDSRIYDPAMTEGDEANLPPESEADPSSDA